MLNTFARGFVTKVLTPFAKALLALGVTPDMVTLTGTLGVCAGALAFYPRHELFWGTMVITAFVFWDVLDGTMARLSGRVSKWGAFLDSTLDRVADGAIFGGLLLWYGRQPGTQSYVMACLLLICLVAGLVTSYARARAEGLGMTGNVGVAERGERLVVVLVAAGVTGLGVPEHIFVWIVGALALASVVTVIQRMLHVRRQSRAA